MARSSNSITKLLRHRLNTDGSTPPPIPRNLYENNIPSREECPIELVVDRLVKTVEYQRKKNAAFESRIESKLAPRPHALFGQSLIYATFGLLSMVGAAFIGDHVYAANKQLWGVTTDMAGGLLETMMVQEMLNELRVPGLSEAGAEDK